MTSALYISASTVICNRIVYRNGRPLFEEPGAGADHFLLSVYQHFGLKYPKFYKMDNLSKLGLLAAEVLLVEGFQKETYATDEIGVVLTNASASLDTDLKYFETTKNIPSPALFVYTLPSILIGEICIRHHIKGESAFFLSEQLDAGWLHQYVSSLLLNGQLRACICGWVEFLGTEFNAAMFLVEKHGPAHSAETSLHSTFTPDNINKIYRIENGKTYVGPENSDYCPIEFAGRQTRRH